MYLEDAHWQASVLAELKRCQAVVVQPGSTTGVRWELEQIRRHVEPFRVLFCLVSYWKDPQSYEALETISREGLGLELPRVVPFLERPSFVYFDRGWLPRVQELSYKNPVLWPLTADAADLHYTLDPFVQGMHGGEREGPRALRWRRGIGKSLADVAAVLIALIILFVPVVTINLVAKYAVGSFVSSRSGVDERQKADVVARSPKITLEGRAVPYRFELPQAFVTQPPENELVEHARSSPDNLLSLQVVAHKQREDLTTVAQARLKMNSGKGIAESKLESVRTIKQAGVDWVETQIVAKLENGIAAKEIFRATSGEKGSVFVVTLLLGSAVTDPVYNRVAEEILASFRFAESPASSVESAQAKPKETPATKAPPAKPEPDRDDTFETIVSESGLKGPVWDAEHRDGHYQIGEEKIRFLFGSRAMAPEGGKSLPSWPDIANYAAQVDGDLHVSGDPFYYVLLERQTLLVLRFKNLTRDWDGYVAVYRTQDGSYFYKWSGVDLPWKALAKGEPFDIQWKESDKLLVHIDIARPSQNEHEKDGEVDYRFRLEEVSKER